MIFSLQVHKTIKSNNAIMNGFLILFEYIKLKIGKERKKKTDKTSRRKKKVESIKLNVATVTTSKKPTVRLFK